VHVVRRQAYHSADDRVRIVHEEHRQERKQIVNSAVASLSHLRSHLALTLSALRVDDATGQTREEEAAALEARLASALRFQERWRSSWIAPKLPPTPGSECASDEDTTTGDGRDAASAVGQQRLEPLTRRYRDDRGGTRIVVSTLPPVSVRQLMGPKIGPKMGPDERARTAAGATRSHPVGVSSPRAHSSHGLSAPAPPHLAELLSSKRSLMRAASSPQPLVPPASLSTIATNEASAHAQHAGAARVQHAVPGTATSEYAWPATVLRLDRRARGVTR
jgi:hypothetical protein